MSALSWRPPDDLDERLAAEAALEGKPRSEVAREAISDYLARRERGRFMADLVAEARIGYSDAGVRAEAIGITEDFLPLDYESTALTN